MLDPTGRIIPARDFIDAVDPTETGRELDCARGRLSDGRTVALYPGRLPEDPARLLLEI